MGSDRNNIGIQLPIVREMVAWTGFLSLLRLCPEEALPRRGAVGWVFCGLLAVLADFFGLFCLGFRISICFGVVLAFFGGLGLLIF